MKKLKDLLNAILKEQMPDTARQHIELAQSLIEVKQHVLKPADFAPSGFYKIPGYENYAVNKEGNVYSRKKKNGFLSPWIEKSGHVRVELRDNLDKRDKRYVHDLVLTTFVGPRPLGLVGCHRNDEKEDNRSENLFWGTRTENSTDFLRNTGDPVLTPELREMVKIALKDGLSQVDIARAFAVSQSTISRIKHNLN